ncbi:hypothetical protein GCK72_026073 [Caenorhabditis remanei]|uniref:C6 domain-containing protein n=1 Tax=Caenorhabditis remanei TaxID=31234 RepID=A0A6A5G4G9_CAERE|nr:hypothetical protein GCK72_026073 [Caenorhabditis remanei]KAF1749605.1 hypothetical protein GCK72_026073 [Caenorhabditis remanei]
MNQWDNCTQSLFYTCRLGNVTGTVTAIGISTNININLDAINMPMLNIGQVRFITNDTLTTINTTLICDTSSRLWAVNSLQFGEQFSTFACAYMYSNGTWSWQ